MLCKVNVVIEKDGYGYYAYCSELEGCQTQGDTLEEVLDNMKEAIELYLGTLPENGKGLLRLELRQLSRDEEAHFTIVDTKPFPGSHDRNSLITATQARQPIFLYVGGP